MLIYSIAHNKPTMVEFLLSNGFDVNWQPHIRADTAIFYVIHNNFENLIDILLKYDVDFSKTNSYHMTPVYHAIYRKKYRLLDKMFLQGAQFNIKEFNDAVEEFKGVIPKFEDLDVRVKRVLIAHLCKDIIYLVFEKRKNIYNIYDKRDEEFKKLPLFTLRNYIFKNLIELFV
jgi:hypothetical protein